MPRSARARPQAEAVTALQATSVVLMAVSWFVVMLVQSPPDQAPAQNAVLGFVEIVVGCYVVQLASVAAHELGHATVGRLLGLRIEALELGHGPVRRRLRIGRGAVTLRRWPASSGRVRLARLASAPRLSQAAVLVAGLTVNTAVVVTTCLAADPRHDWIATAILLTNLRMVLIGVVPTHGHDGTPSDSRQLVDLLSPSRAAPPR